MSGPACRTSSSVPPAAICVSPCISAPNPLRLGSLGVNKESFTHSCCPLARSKSPTTAGPAARVPCTRSVPLWGRTRRVATCVRSSFRESKIPAPVTGSKIISSPCRFASMRSEPSTGWMLSAAKPPSSGLSQATRPRSMSTPASVLSVETRRAPAGVICCQ